MYAEPVMYSTRSVPGKRGSKLEVGGKTDGGVPAMGNETDAVGVRKPTDSTCLAEAAHLGGVGLHDVDGTTLNQGRKLWRRVRTSQPAIGTFTCRRRAMKSSMSSGLSGSSNQVTS